MSKTNVFQLGGQPLALDLQSVLGDGEGQALTLPDGITKFNFSFRYVRFVAHLELAGGKAELRLVGDLGPLPFSAESPAARAGLARIVEAAQDHLGPRSVMVTKGRILVRGTVPVPVPVTATGLITELTRYFMPVMSYMELVALYVHPPLVPRRPGDASLRREWRGVGISAQGR